MSPLLQSLGIDQMNRDQRLALVQELWDTIVAQEQPQLLNEAQRLEIQRRVVEDNAAPDDVIPWEQVKAQTLARFQP